MGVNQLELRKSMTAHFRARIAEETVVVEVPEWPVKDVDGKEVPLKIHSHTMSLRQRDRVYKIMSEGSTLLSFAEAILEMAHDEEGKPIWPEGQARDIQRDVMLDETDPDVIMRVTREMRGGKPPVDKPDEEIEEASGN